MIYAQGSKMATLRRRRPCRYAHRIRIPAQPRGSGTTFGFVSHPSHSRAEFVRNREGFSRHSMLLLRGTGALETLNDAREMPEM